jgi:hypothetical protein
MIPVTYATHISTRSKKPNRGSRFGVASIRFIGFMILAIFGLLYIAQTSQGATKRVEVHQLRNQADVLSQEQEQLQLEALRLQSLDTIDQAAASLGLENVTSVEELNKR